MSAIIEDAISLCLGIILILLLISSFYVGLNQYTSITDKINKEHRAKEETMKIMKLDGYDDTTVSGTQVLYAIADNKGTDLGINITDKNVYYNIKYNENNKRYEVGNNVIKEDEKFELKEIMDTNVDINKNYKSQLVYDANEAVAMIKFTII